MMKKKKPTLPRSPLPYDSDYDAFVQELELVGLALKSCNCDLDRSAYFSLTKQVRAFSQKYRSTDLSERSFDAEGDFELSISESAEKVPAVKMECVFKVHIHAKEPLSPEYAERFIDNELRLILVPYARQLFFTLSGQMSIPPLVLPLTTGSYGNVAKQQRGLKTTPHQIQREGSA
jgi:hypothetical protein